MVMIGDQANGDDWWPVMEAEKKSHHKGRRKDSEEESPTEKILGDEHWRRWEEKNKLPYVS